MTSVRAIALALTAWGLAPQALASDSLRVGPYGLGDFLRVAFFEGEKTREVAWADVRDVTRTAEGYRVRTREGESIATAVELRRYDRPGGRPVAGLLIAPPEGVSFSREDLLREAENGMNADFREALYKSSVFPRQWGQLMSGAYALRLDEGGPHQRDVPLKHIQQVLWDPTDPERPWVVGHGAREAKLVLVDRGLVTVWEKDPLVIELPRPVSSEPMGLAPKELLRAAFVFNARATRWELDGTGDDWRLSYYERHQREHGKETAHTPAREEVPSADAWGQRAAEWPWLGPYRLPDLVEVTTIDDDGRLEVHPLSQVTGLHRSGEAFVLQMTQGRQTARRVAMRVLGIELPVPLASGGHDLSGLDLLRWTVGALEARTGDSAEAFLRGAAAELGEVGRALGPLVSEGHWIVTDAEGAADPFHDHPGWRLKDVRDIEWQGGARTWVLHAHSSFEAQPYRDHPFASPQITLAAPLFLLDPETGAAVRLPTPPASEAGSQPVHLPAETAAAFALLLGPARAGRPLAEFARERLALLGGDFARPPRPPPVDDPELFRVRRARAGAAAWSRTTALGDDRAVIRLTGPLAGGRRRAPLSIPLGEVEDAYSLDGVWHIRLLQANESFVFRSLSRNGEAVDTADAQLHLTEAERAAESPEAAARRGRMVRLRSMVSDPRHGDISGPLAGGGLLELSSLHLDDAWFDRDRGIWSVVADGQTHHFLEEDPATGRRFALGDAQRQSESKPAVFGKKPRAGRR